MTPEQIKAMPAGPELDVAVHQAWHPEDVIEWRWCGYSEGKLSYIYPGRPSQAVLRYKDARWLPCHKVNGKWVPIPAYSTDGNVMLALWERIEASPRHNLTMAHRMRKVYIDDINCKELARATFKSIKQLPHAVAKAAALAKLPKGEEGCANADLRALQVGEQIS